MRKKLSQIQVKIISIMKITKWSNKKRSILNEKYLYNNKIPFIYLNAGRLAISGFVNSINGYYEQYIMSVHDILNKIKLKKYLKKEIQKRKIKKINNNLFIIMYQWNTLPNNLNSKIINYLN